MTHAAKQNTNGFDGPLQRRFQTFFYDWAFSGEKTAEEVLETYFDREFSALIDGKRLSRKDFGARIVVMRRDVIVERQDFLQMMEDGDRLFSMHRVWGKSLVSEAPFETFAIAYFQFRGGRLLKGYLNSATVGDPRDLDIASRH
ncbi:hypothetical protein [Roseibium sp. RKSG952]|uniref:hypothetical protein n=1 Tax=Roseibium sp. RKSG952 TaxID=2529384 RepID=UPI0012BC3DC2|nr:hypothetical protein [Roseibium sp. RKSG952]MTH95789.1 hypothetical protein [Roseibium sp. RKSG952]